MNREVEERLVAMYFDNRDFEKNAKQTIDTLGQLKNSMNLEDSVKGFDVFSKMKRTAGIDQMQKSADKLKDSFSGIGTVLSKTFSIASAPVRKFESTLKTMGGYIKKYLGFDIAGKIVHGVENFAQAIAVQPVGQGWEQYGNKIDSVKTIMSSTGEEIGVVNTALDELRAYADQTVYSLNDMTSNLGKFTNNGVGLEDAKLAMMGIANAAADAGQGTQQASMAMYNFSQAMGVGKMTTMDWKSIENANMATTRLKDAFIKVAAAQNKLKRVDQGDGTYKYFLTTDSNGKQIKDKSKWTEINTNNFRDTLKEDWLTKETMIAALQVYSGQITDLDKLLEAIPGIEGDKELQDYLLGIGRDALEAASQVRTFDKMMDTLKDSAASGFAETFELIFGGLDESTSLWTRLSEEIGGVLDAFAEWRNGILKDWAERGGRTELFESIYALVDIIKTLGQTAINVFSDVFGVGNLDGERLYDLTVKLREGIKHFSEWLGKADEEGSRLNKIQRIFRGVLSVVKVVVTLFKSLYSTIAKWLAPVFGKLGNALLGISDFFYEIRDMKPEEIFAKIGEKLKGVWEKVKKFFTPQAIYDSNGWKIGEEIPAITWLKNLWQNLKTTVVTFAQNVGLGGFIDWLSGIWKTIEETWAAVSAKLEPILGTIGAALLNLWDWMAKAAGTVWEFFTEPKYDGKTGFSVWLEEAIAWITETWAGLMSIINPILEPIGRFFSNTFEWIRTELGIAVDFMAKPNESGKTGFAEWIDQAITFLIDTWNNVYGFLCEFLRPVGEFFSNAFEWIGTKLGIAVDFMSKPNDDGKTGFAEWIDQAVAFLSETWNNVYGALREFLRPVGEFFSDVFAWIGNEFGIAVNFMTKPNEDGKTGFALWIDQAVAFLSQTWNNVYSALCEFLRPVGEFFSDVFAWIGNEFGIAVNFMTKPNEDGKTGFAEWIDQAVAFLSETWNNVYGALREFLRPVGEFFSDVFAWIGNEFGIAVNFMTKPNEDGKTGFAEWIDQAVAFLSQIWNNAYGFLCDFLRPVGEFFSDAFTWIADKLHIAVDFMSKPNEDGKTGFALWIDQAVAFLSSTWTTVYGALCEFLRPVGEFFNNAFEWIGNEFGIAVDFMSKPNEDGKTGFALWIEQAVEFLSSTWTTVYGALCEFLRPVGEFFSDIFAWIGNQFNIAVDFMSKPNEDGKTGFAEWIDQAVTFLSETWGRVYGFLREFLRPVGTFFSNIFEWIKSELNIAVDFMSKPNEDGKTGFAEWIDQAVAFLSETWTNLYGFLCEFLRPVGEFFSDVFEWIQKRLNIAADFMTKPNEDGKTGFSEWLELFVGKIQRIWQEYVTDDKLGIFHAIGEFFNNIFGAISGIFHSGEVESGAAESTEEATGIVEETADAIAQAADSAPSEGQLSLIERIFGVIGTVIDKIKEFMGGIVNLDGATTFIKQLGEFFQGIIDYLGRNLAKIGRILSGKGQSGDWTGFAALLLPGGAIYTLILIMNHVVGKVGGAGDSLGRQILFILGGMLLLAIAIEKLSVIDADKLSTAANVLIDIGLILAIILALTNGTLGGLTGLAETKVPVTSGERVLNNLIKNLSMIGMVTIVMSLLPNIITAIANVKKDLAAAGADASFGQDLLQTVLSVVVLVGGIGLVFSVIQRIAPTGISPVATLKTVGSIGIVIGSIILVVDAIKGVEEKLGKTGYTAEALSDAGSTIGSILTSLGAGLGQFFFRLGNGGLSYEEKTNMDRQITEAFLDKIANMSKEFPMEDLERIVKICGDMVDIYNKVAHQTGALQGTMAATDISESFRNIAGVILDIMKAFDMSAGYLDDTFDGITKEMTDNPGAFMNPESTFYRNGNEEVRQYAKVLNNATISLSEWTSFGEGGEVYNAMVRFMDMYKLVFEMLDSVLTPNISREFGTLDQSRYEAFWDRIFGFFGGDVAVTTKDGEQVIFSRFELLIGSIISAYQSLDFYSKYLAPYANDSQYQIIIEVIGNLTGILTGLLTEGVVNVFGKEETEYGRWWEQFINFAGGTAFGEFLDAVVRMYGQISDRSGDLTKYNNTGLSILLDNVKALFMLFSMEGLGSAVWEENFAAFTKKVKSAEFVEAYISNIETIFHAIENSSLYDAETGEMRGLVFDGAAIVRRLFESMEQGFRDPSIPAFNAQPVTDAIVKAIGVSDQELQIAKAVHTMIQDGLLVFGENPTYGEFMTTDSITEFQKLINGLDFGNIADEGYLSQFTSQLNGMFSVENLTGGMSIDKFSEEMSKYMSTAQDAFKITDTEGNNYTIAEYLKGELTGVEEELNNLGAFEIQLQPTFDLTKLTEEELQKQLDEYRLNVPATIQIPGLSLDFEGLRAALEIEALKQKLDLIAEYIQYWGRENNNTAAGLGTRIDNAGKSLSGVRVVLDSGALVGQILPQIDVGLYKRYVAASRSASLPDSPYPVAVYDRP